MATEKQTTMYHVNPVVSDLNRVAGFDPLKYVRMTKEGATLDLLYKKLWFRMKHPNGIIRPLLLQMTDQLAIIEARVFFDRRDSEPAASYIAQCSKSETGDYVRRAQNSAIDQALSDAGFGLQFIPASPEKVAAQPVKEAASEPAKAPEPAVTLQEPEPVQAEVPVIQAETVVPEVKTAAPAEEPAVPEVKTTASAEEPAVQKQEPTVVPAAIVTEPKEESASAPAYTADMPVEQICSMMTLDEAQSYVVKEGTCSGWTMAQVMDRRPASLKFYLNGYGGKDNILRAAARILTQAAA